MSGGYMEEMRQQFEQEAANTLDLPVQMIVDARKGDGYDHSYNSMNVMQPLNEWWHWWKKSRASLVVELPVIFGAGRTLNTLRVAIKECAETLKEAGITVKGEGDLISTPDHVLDKKWHDHFGKGEGDETNPNDSR